MNTNERAKYILEVINQPGLTEQDRILIIERQLDMAALAPERWIPITELKPIHGNNVSVLFHNGTRVCACYVSGTSHWYWNDGRWLDESLIAAWCEMPFAPKQENSR